MIGNLLNNNRNNVARTVQCIFKKVYTTNIFNLEVNPCNNTESLYHMVLERVHQTMFSNRDNFNINDFELVMVGEGEEAEAFSPNNICIKNALNFIDYDQSYSLYVREKNAIDIQCPVCYENIGITNRFQCSHQFCNSCTNNWLNTCIVINRTPNCPMCRANLLL